MYKIITKSIDQLNAGDVVCVATKCTDSAILRIGVVHSIDNGKLKIHTLSNNGKVYRLNTVYRRVNEYRWNKDQVVYKGNIHSAFTSEQEELLKNSYTSLSGVRTTIFDYIKSLSNADNSNSI